MSKATVKSLLAEYEIGFVTHGKDVNEHLKKFENALDTLFTEQMEKHADELHTAIEALHLPDYDDTDKYQQCYEWCLGQVLTELAVSHQRLEESRKELFDDTRPE